MGHVDHARQAVRHWTSGNKVGLCWSTALKLVLYQEIALLYHSLSSLYLFVFSVAIVLEVHCFLA